VKDLLISIACVAFIAGCATRQAPRDTVSQPTATQTPKSAPELPQITEKMPKGPKEIFPGVFFDIDHNIVSFEGIVAIDAHNDRTPTVYLEAIVCTKDTKEHESLVVTQARPSHIHAALLLAGHVPGAPGSFDWTGETMKPVQPKGDEVEVRLIAPGADSDPRTWIMNARTQITLRETLQRSHFVFAGSLERTKQGVTMYDADHSGTLIGLSTFGTETIAFSQLLNPDSGIEEPVWIADRRQVPKLGTPVRIEIGSIQR